LIYEVRDDKIIRGLGIRKSMLKWTGGDLYPNLSGDITRDSLFSLRHRGFLLRVKHFRNNRTRY
jgi:hypothetical protein